MKKFAKSHKQVNPQPKSKSPPKKVQSEPTRIRREFKITDISPPDNDKKNSILTSRNILENLLKNTNEALKENPNYERLIILKKDLERRLELQIIQEKLREYERRERELMAKERNEKIDRLDCNFLKLQAILDENFIIPTKCTSKESSKTRKTNKGAK
jgi:hypothetical protein